MLNLALNAFSTATIILMFDSESHVATSSAFSPSVTTSVLSLKTSRKIGVKRATISALSILNLFSQFVDNWRHECSARLIGADRERPLGCAALAVRNLLESEALKEPLHHVVLLGWKVMTSDAFRALSRGVGKDVVHGEVFDATLQN